MLEVTIVNSGKDIGRSSDSSDRLHARVMCLDLTCPMKTVGGTKDTVLSSRKTCLHHLLVRNLTVSAPNKVMGIQGVGGRTGRCPPLHELGNWHHSIPGLKTFFKSIIVWLVAHLVLVVMFCLVSHYVIAAQIQVFQWSPCLPTDSNQISSLHGWPIIFSISNQPSNHSRFT